MGLTATLERRFPWLAFPGLIRIIVMLQCVVYALIVMRPEARDAFFMDPVKLLEGEYWRIISWLFLPIISPTGGFGPLIGALFMFFILNIAFLFDTSIDTAWGSFRLSIFLYASILCQIVVAFLGLSPFPPSYLLYLSIFFVFATLFPNHQFLLMLVIPVKVWMLAVFSGVMLLLPIFTFPIFLIGLVIALLPYLVWAVPLLRKTAKMRSQVSQRRTKLQSQSASAGTTLHRCLTCDRTELSHPELSFRVAADGEEYCLDHLPNADKPPSA